MSLVVQIFKAELELVRFRKTIKKKFTRPISEYYKYLKQTNEDDKNIFDLDLKIFLISMKKDPK